MQTNETAIRNVIEQILARSVHDGLLLGFVVDSSSFLAHRQMVENGGNPC